MHTWFYLYIDKKAEVKQGGNSANLPKLAFQYDGMLGCLCLKLSEGSYF